MTIFRLLKVLSKQEMRPLRQTLVFNPALKLCGKGIRKHCDSDGDGGVTEREWEVCVGVRKEGAKTKENPCDDHFSDQL